MPFRARNAQYLRISAHTILPLYLYLDDRHIEWMTDRVLQYVLADLRPLILPKLRAESDVHLGPGGPTSAKKGTVDVHRGDHYQFAFFFRKTEPHSVIVKTRQFVAAPKQINKPIAPKTVSEQPGKRKQTGDTGSRAPKKKKTKASQQASHNRGSRPGKKLAVREEMEFISDDEDEDDDLYAPDPVDVSKAPRRSQRTRKPVTTGYREDSDAEDDGDVELVDVRNSTTVPQQDVEMDGPQDEFVPEVGPSSGADDTAVKSEGVEPDLLQRTTNSHLPDVQVPPTAPLRDPSEDIEDKPKPVLELKYQGFSVHDRCLCLIVEPWPPMPSVSRAPSIAPQQSRAPSIAPPNFIASTDPRSASSEPGIRARTPLFLPDFDRDRSATPAPTGGLRVLPPVPLFDDPVSLEEDEDDYELLAFSQALNSAAGDRSGAVDEDDEMDGGVLFGDADEQRAL